MCPTATARPGRPGRPVDHNRTARRREEILSAATRLFADHGYAETDVESVADGLGIAKGTIYRYFPSKKALFLAALDREMIEMIAAVNRGAGLIADPLDRIAAAIREFLRYFHRRPELTGLFIQERAWFRGRRPAAYFSHCEKESEPWRQMYARLVREGRVRDFPLGWEDDVVNDLMYGTILANHITGRRVDPDRQADRIIDLVFDGILTDAERSRRRRRRKST